MVCPPATSEAGARWPRFGLVVATTTSRRDNKDQMIRPLMSKNSHLLLLGAFFHQMEYFTGAEQISSKYYKGPIMYGHNIVAS
jgi:hypothetical protein